MAVLRFTSNEIRSIGAPPEITAEEKAERLLEIQLHQIALEQEREAREAERAAAQAEAEAQERIEAARQEREARARLQAEYAERSRQGRGAPQPGSHGRGMA